MPSFTELSQGAGEPVCQVLLSLCKRTLTAKKFKFKKPVFKEEEGGEEGEDMMEDDMEGNADIADLANQEIEEEEDFAELVEGGAGDHKHDFENQQNMVIESQINPEEWYMECERVAHKLKINANTDAKEWRSHLEQTKKYAEIVKKNLPDVRYKLERVSDDVSKALERIAKKESMLNKTFQSMAGDYRSHAESLKDMTNQYQQLNTSVQELEKQLYDTNDKLETTEKQINECGQNLSDTGPLQKVKGALNVVKTELKDIDIRIGVVSNLSLIHI